MYSRLKKRIPHTKCNRLCYYRVKTDLVCHQRAHKQPPCFRVRRTDSSTQSAVPPYRTLSALSPNPQTAQLQLRHGQQAKQWLLSRYGVQHTQHRSSTTKLSSAIPRPAVWYYQAVLTSIGFSELPKGVGLIRLFCLLPCHESSKKYGKLVSKSALKLD